MRLVSLVSLASPIFLLLACTRTNPQYCDRETSCAVGQCDYDSNACIEDGDGGPADAAPDAMTCESTAMCSGNAPICDDTDNVCRGCEPSGGDAPECAALGAGTPQCADDGRCVECATSAACAGLTPVCDEVEKSCRSCSDDNECTESGFGTCAPDGGCVGCLEHSDCPESDVCDARTRQCAAAASVIYVGGMGAANVPLCGTTVQPCLTIQYALDEKVDATHDVIRMSDGDYGDAAFDGVAVLVAGPGAVLRGAQSGKEVVSVSSGADVYLDGLEIRNGYGDSSAHGLQCSGNDTTLTLRQVDIGYNQGRGVVSDCDLTIEGGSILSNGGTGLNVTGGTVRVQGVTATANQGGGIHIQGTAFHVVNSIIADNGGASSSIGGVRIGNFDNVSPQVLAFNTIADNTSSSSSPAYGVFCDVVNASESTFRSNIVWGGNGPSSAVAGTCSFTYSDVSGGLAGTGNLDVDPGFVGSGDYHLEPGSPVQDQGSAVPGVSRDIDGELRDASPDIGADEL